MREFKTEFDAISTGDVTEDEVRKARLTRRSDLIATAETTNGLANNFAALIADDRPLSAIGDEIRALETVTVDDVRGIATSGLLNWDSMLVVLVGDAASVREQLEEAGFPEPVMATAEGKLVAATDQSAVTAP